jgi:4a-hydroxytetrahydrobiopterin dehydratase
MYTSLMTSIIKDTDSNREIWVSRHPGWLPTCSGDALKVYHFLTFKEAIEFVNEISLVAMTTQHYPEIGIHGATVSLRLKGDPEKGLDGKDADFMERVDELPYSEAEVEVVQ